MQLIAINRSKAHTVFLTEEEMAPIKIVKKFLTKLYILSTVGGDMYVTSSVLTKKMLQEDNSDPLYIARNEEVISENFSRRVAKNIDTDFFLLATALNPR